MGYGWCKKHKCRLVLGHNFEGVCLICQKEEREARRISNQKAVQNANGSEADER